MPAAGKVAQARYAEAALSIRDLVVEFRTGHGALRAVDGVTLDLVAGQTLGLVGESGSGKTVTALSVLRLLDPRAGRIVRGRILYHGSDLVTLPEAELRPIRGNRIA